MPVRKEKQLKKELDKKLRIFCQNFGIKGRLKQEALLELHSIIQLYTLDTAIMSI